MTILQRWIIAVRGRSDCGILLGGQRLVGVCGDGVATAAHHHQRSLIPVSCEPETTMQAAQLLHNCLLPQQAFEIRIGGLSISRVPGESCAFRK